jgi:hypothetical protein
VLRESGSSRKRGWQAKAPAKAPAPPCLRDRARGFPIALQVSLRDEGTFRKVCVSY